MIDVCTLLSYQFVVYLCVTSHFVLLVGLSHSLVLEFAPLRYNSRPHVKFRALVLELATSRYNLRLSLFFNHLSIDSNHFQMKIKS